MNRKRKKTAILFLTILLGLLLAACSSGQNASGGDTESLVSGGAASDPAAADGDSAAEDSSGESGEETSYNIGSFTMEDINGESYTESMFQDYDLTLVNVFATWCSPCIEEIPHLEQLSQDMADNGVHVVGIVLDTLASDGTVDTDAVEAAQTLATELETSYPFLIPDSGLMNGLLTGIQSVPTTFFVDSEGNLLERAYLGSRSLTEWTEIVNTELEALGGTE